MKNLTLILTLVLFATPLFAHAGHAHTYMGTVTMIHNQNEFMMKTTEGKDVTIKTSAATQYLHSDDLAAKRAELVIGSRVVIKMKADGKTAASVKMSTKAPKAPKK